jgi:hypothetical protein
MGEFFHSDIRSFSSLGGNTKKEHSPPEVSQIP